VAILTVLNLFANDSERPEAFCITGARNNQGQSDRRNTEAVLLRILIDVVLVLIVVYLMQEIGGHLCSYLGFSEAFNEAID
jgi:hypothetical protein